MVNQPSNIPLASEEHPAVLLMETRIHSGEVLPAHIHRMYKMHGGPWIWEILLKWTKWSSQTELTAVVCTEAGKSVYLFISIIPNEMGSSVLDTWCLIMQDMVNIFCLLYELCFGTHTLLAIVHKWRQTYNLMHNVTSKCMNEGYLLYKCKTL